MKAWRALRQPAWTHDRATVSLDPEATVLQTNDLALGYGPIPVVSGLQLCVRAGELVALLGANGAGKSTTIRGLAGELEPLEGSVTFLGQTARSPLHLRARRGLALVPEERSVIMGLTVRDNLRLGAGGVAGALEYGPELAALLDRPAKLLSGGELQILALSRALASKPRLFLADELSLGLAPLAVERLLTATRKAADEGVAVLLVEQHVRSALSVADRIYVMRRGRIVLEGAAADLASRTDEIEMAYLAAEGAQ